MYNENENICSVEEKSTEKEKEEEEIFGEGKDIFYRGEENGDGKG